MEMMFTVFFVVLGAFFIADLFGAKKMLNKDDDKKRASQVVASSASAEKSMASPKSVIAPALLEERDFSEFDTPTFLRRRHEKKHAEAKATLEKHQIPAKSAHSDKPKAAKTPRNPKISLDEFKANAGQKPAQYVEV